MEPSVDYDRISGEMREHIRDPYDKASIDPLSRMNIILMHAKETEQWMMYHSYFTFMDLEDLRRMAAEIATEEDGHGVVLASLMNPAETPLERLLAAEQAIVQGYAAFAMAEPEDKLRNAFDYIIADHMEHARIIGEWLRRQGTDPVQVTRGSLDLEQGRPMPLQHLSLEDTIKESVPVEEMDALSAVHLSLLRAAEKDAWLNYHKALTMEGDREMRTMMAQMSRIEHQHLTMLSSMMDPDLGGLQSLVVSEFAEVTGYRVCLQQEKNEAVADALRYNLHQDEHQLGMLNEAMGRYLDLTVADMMGETEPLPPETSVAAAKEYLTDILPEQREIVSEGREFKRRAA